MRKNNKSCDSANRDSRFVEAQRSLKTMDRRGEQVLYPESPDPETTAQPRAKPDPTHRSDLLAIFGEFRHRFVAIMKSFRHR